MVYADIVLWAVFGPIVLVALIYTIRAAIGWAGLSGEAASDRDYRRANDMLGGQLAPEQFLRIYRRVNGPRGATYVAAALWGVLLATPLIAKILEVLLEALYQATGRSRVFEPGYLVWQFFIFFGLFGAWAAIAYIVARRYHKRTPGRFEDEVRALQV